MGVEAFISQRLSSSQDGIVWSSAPRERLFSREEETEGVFAELPASTQSTEKAPCAANGDRRDYRGAEA